jgi:hypothetical protein
MFVKLGPPGRKNKAETIVIDDYDVWNLDTKGMKKHSDKIDSGIMLFAKYYGGLWD